jgi:hypothetical protein
MKIVGGQHIYLVEKATGRGVTHEVLKGIVIYICSKSGDIFSEELLRIIICLFDSPGKFALKQYFQLISSIHATWTIDHKV